MNDWFHHFDESLRLKGDDTGEKDATFIMKALNLKPGVRVLDIPCGAGRVAVHLAKAGCFLTCIDLNANFVERARKRFTEEKLKGDFYTLDMRKLAYCDEFDAIYDWGGSFGYFTNDVNFDVLRSMAAALKPGGRLLIDQPNREWLLRNFQPLINNGLFAMQTRWNTSDQRIETTWHLEGCGEQSAGFSSISLYTPAQFRRLFTQAGLSLEEAYGGIDGSPYTRSSRRLIMVGRK